MAVEEQIITIFASTRGFTDTLKIEEVVRFKKFLLKYLHQKHPEIMRNFAKNPDLTPEMEQNFSALIKEFFEEVYMLQYHPEVYHAEKERREAKAAIEATEAKAAAARKKKE
jgi:esterase/lipase